MKKIIPFIISLIFISCGKGIPKYFKKEQINVKVTITEISHYKYSKIKGFFYHNNFKIPIDNGPSGYYYKKYNLTIGQKINRKLTVYYYDTSDGYGVSFSNLDVKDYEIK